MRISYRLLSLPPTHVGMHHFSDNRAGPNDSDLYDEIVELARSITRPSRPNAGPNAAASPGCVRTTPSIFGREDDSGRSPLVENDFRSYRTARAILRCSPRSKAGRASLDRIQALCQLPAPRNGLDR